MYERFELVERVSHLLCSDMPSLGMVTSKPVCLCCGQFILMRLIGSYADPLGTSVFWLYFR